jgi:hypothetical protein
MIPFKVMMAGRAKAQSNGDAGSLIDRVAATFIVGIWLL